MWESQDITNRQQRSNSMTDYFHSWFSDRLYVYDWYERVSINRRHCQIFKSWNPVDFDLRQSRRFAIVESAVIYIYTVLDGSSNNKKRLLLVKEMECPVRTSRLSKKKKKNSIYGTVDILLDRRILEIMYYVALELSFKNYNNHRNKDLLWRSLGCFLNRSEIRPRGVWSKSLRTSSYICFKYTARTNMFLELCKLWAVL